MSKQSEAKEKQGYDPKPVNRICSNCVFYGSTFDYPKWLKERGKTEEWMKERGYSKQEYNLRCGIGGFAIKRRSSCKEHKFDSEALV